MGCYWAPTAIPIPTQMLSVEFQLLRTSLRHIHTLARRWSTKLHAGIKVRAGRKISQISRCIGELIAARSQKYWSLTTASITARRRRSRGRKDRYLGEGGVIGARTQGNQGSTATEHSKVDCSALKPIRSVINCIGSLFTGDSDLVAPTFQITSVGYIMIINMKKKKQQLQLHSSHKH